MNLYDAIKRETGETEMKTADKTEALGTCTESTLSWAQSHDWGCEAWLCDGCVMIEHPEEGLLRFESYRVLRNWAGY